MGRSRSIEIDFSCSLTLDKLVSLTSGISPLLAKMTKIELENKEGSFDVSMGVFTDNQYTTQVTDEKFSVNVPEPLFIGLELSDNAMVLDTTKCWATPSADANDELLKIETNGKGSKVQFQLASFSFIDNAEAQIFIHCNVHLCDPALEKCEPDCSSGRRRRRSTGSYLPPIAIGPVFVKNPNH